MATKTAPDTAAADAVPVEVSVQAGQDQPVVSLAPLSGEPTPETRERQPKAPPTMLPIVPATLAAANVTTIAGASLVSAFGAAGLITGGVVAAGIAATAVAARSSWAREGAARALGKAKASPLGAALKGAKNSGLGSKLGGLLGAQRGGFGAKAAKGANGLGRTAGKGLLGRMGKGSGSAGRGTARQGFGGKGGAGRKTASKGPLSRLAKAAGKGFPRFGAASRGAQGRKGVPNVLGKGKGKGKGRGRGAKPASGMWAKAAKAAQKSKSPAAKAGGAAKKSWGWLSKAAKAAGKGTKSWWQNKNKKEAAAESAEENSAERVASDIRTSPQTEAVRPHVQAPEPAAQNDYVPSFGFVGARTHTYQEVNAMGFRLAEVSAEMHAAACHYSPEGMGQVEQDVKRIPEVLGNVAQAIKVYMERSREEMPIDSTVVEVLGQAHQLLLHALEVSGELSPTFRNKHDNDLARLHNPRRNERMWDVGVNR